MNSNLNHRHSNGKESNGDGEMGDNCKIGAVPIKTEPPPKLLELELMPKHLQFNPFVHTGYRPQMNTWECIKSLTYFHNETLNILTHGKLSQLI